MTDEERLSKLQEFLGGIGREHAKRIWQLISTTRADMKWLDAGRAKVPDVQKAKRDLAAIAKTARKLFDQMKNEPLRLYLIRDDIPINCSDTELDANVRAAVSFLWRLERVSQRAEKLSCDDADFRETHALPGPEQASLGPAQIHLWPFLFSVWEKAGKRKLAYTPDGPLQKFIDFIHIEMELPRPGQSALRTAVNSHIAKLHQK
jgi:hypothetical protein